MTISLTFRCPLPLSLIKIKYLSKKESSKSERTQGQIPNKMRGNEDYDGSFGDEDDKLVDNTPPPPEVGIYPMFLWQMSIIWNYLATTSHQIMVDFGVLNIAEKLARKAVQHPFITFTLAATFLSIGLPLLIISVIALSTVMMTFTGFVLLEGTLISISSVLLFGCIGAMLIVFLFFAGVTLAGYFGFLHIYDLYRGIHNKSAITDYLRRERRSVS